MRRLRNLGGCRGNRQPGAELRTHKVNELSHRPPGGRAGFWNQETDWDAGCIQNSGRTGMAGPAESRWEWDGHRAQLPWAWAFQGLRVGGSESARPPALTGSEFPSLHVPFV